jgi:hypothetical protein
MNKRLISPIKRHAVAKTTFQIKKNAEQPFIENEMAGGISLIKNKNISHH